MHHNHVGMTASGYGPPQGGGYGPPQWGYRQPPPGQARPPSAAKKPVNWPYLLAVLLFLASLTLGCVAAVYYVEFNRTDEEFTRADADLRAAQKRGADIEAVLAAATFAKTRRDENETGLQLYGSLGGLSLAGGIALVLLGRSMNRRR